MDPLINNDRVIDYNNDAPPVNEIDIEIQCKILDQNFRSSSKEEVDISVSNPKIKEQKITKHVLYSVSGKDGQGPFESLRRYRDFLLLRSKLIKKWPGCFIPQIPPKKRLTSFAKGNMKPQFIEERRKLLEYFIKRLVSLTYIRHSEEFQLFIRSNLQYKKATNELRTLTYSEIASQFHNEFTEYLLFQLPPDYEKQKDQAESIFKSGVEALENFEELCKRNMEAFNIYDNGLLRLMQGIKDINSFYVQNYNVTKIDVRARQKHKNPFETLLC